MKLTPPLDIHIEQVADQNADQATMCNPDDSTSGIAPGPAIESTDNASMQLGQGLTTNRSKQRGDGFAISPSVQAQAVQLH